MSGIFGYLDNAVSHEILLHKMDRMHAWNKAYGKDAYEQYCDKTYGIGCCSEHYSEAIDSPSPIAIDGNFIISIDAVIYNRHELINKLQCLSSISDEELVYQYTKSFGMSALSEINGDFCGAIFDKSTHSLTLFRDHLGIRPLFYYSHQNVLAFSTDIRGITSLENVDATFSKEWVYSYLSGYSTLSVTNTEYEYINCIKPGSYAIFTFSNENISKQEYPYWKLGQHKIHLKSEQAYKNKLYELVQDSVKMRLDAFPGVVGAELSGGLDSCIISILINRLGRECVYYSWSRSPEKLPYLDKDERLIIRDVCEQEHITCHYRDYSTGFMQSSNMAANTPKTYTGTTSADLPFIRYALPPYINAMTLCDVAQFVSDRGAKVVFSGHGGDEGISHRCDPYEMFYHHEYYHYFRYMYSTTHLDKHRFSSFVKKCKNNLFSTRKELLGTFLNGYATPELLNKDFVKDYVNKEMPSLAFYHDPKRYIEDGGTRVRLDNAAILGAYSGARFVFPYIDYRVIDFAVSIPRYLYVKGHKRRYLFRETFKDIMPRSLFLMNTKEDFSRTHTDDSNSEWFQSFQAKKEYFVKQLDRNLWSKYLDFDFIDKWIAAGEPAASQISHEYFILSNIGLCLELESMVKKSRDLVF